MPEHQYTLKEFQDFVGAMLHRHNDLEFDVCRMEGVQAPVTKLLDTSTVDKCVSEVKKLAAAIDALYVRANEYRNKPLDPHICNLIRNLSVEYSVEVPRG